MLTSLGYFGDARLEKGGAFLVQRLCALGPQGISLRTPGGDWPAKCGFDGCWKIRR